MTSIWKLNFNDNFGIIFLWIQVINLFLHPELRAWVAELVDALVSNTNGCKSLPVRSRLWVPEALTIKWRSGLFLFHQVTGMKFFNYIFYRSYIALMNTKYKPKVNPTEQTNKEYLWLDLKFNSIRLDYSQLWPPPFLEVDSQSH